MKTIWKYTKPVQSEITFNAPANGTILKVGTQVPGEITIWVLLESTNQEAEYKLKVFGTGHPIQYENDTAVYLGSVFDGAYVWHVFLPETFEPISSKITDPLWIKPTER